MEKWEKYFFHHQKFSSIIMKQTMNEKKRNQPDKITSLALTRHLLDHGMGITWVSFGHYFPHQLLGIISWILLLAY